MVAALVVLIAHPILLVVVDVCSWRLLNGC
jgi:hypothetical protein